jgi:hypothetical protein
VSYVSYVEVVPLGWCVDAMYRAFERVRSTGWNDPVGEYAFVSETLFWVSVIDEQLRTKFLPHYETALAEHHEEMVRMLRGLRYARNRITHEVDGVAYVLAEAEGPDGFGANWTWQSLEPRPGERQSALHLDYEALIAGHDVVETLQTVTMFLGQARNSIWQNPRQDSTHPR